MACSASVLPVLMRLMAALTDAIYFPLRMRFGGMRIVAGGAPHLRIGVLQTFALGELFYVTGDLEAASGHVRRPGIFKQLAGHVGTGRLPRVQDASHTGQMALFTDAIAPRARQPYWIDDVQIRWLRRVLRAIAVASLASDRGGLL